MEEKSNYKLKKAPTIIYTVYVNHFRWSSVSVQSNNMSKEYWPVMLPQMTLWVIIQEHLNSGFVLMS